MTRRTFGLSKSRISAFEQCPRRLWQQVHTPERAEIDAATQMSFAAGHEVGDLACGQVPGGIMVDAIPDMQAALLRTDELVALADGPIFEATFQHDGVLVRVDILIPEAQEGKTIWHIAEVKSSGSAKDYHIGDLATQYWVIRQNGLELASAAIRHIDTSFILAILGDYGGIFKDARLLEEIAPIAEGRQALVEDIRKMLAGNEPICVTGAHCTSPFSCEFLDHCGKTGPDGPEWPIRELPNTGRRLADKWGLKGILEIADLPADAELSPLHQRIRDVVISQKPYCDAEGVLQDTKSWAFPWIWLDFETMGFAIPRWVGTKPYGQVPFQFSAHIENKDGALEHIEALDLSGHDPRIHIAEKLADLPDEGTVIAWNAGFERRCLKELAKDVPQFEGQLLSLAERTVDLLPVTKNNYYHPDQRGSFSIKAVLPTLAPELDYSTLEVKDGGNAQAAYIEATHCDCTSQRKTEIESALKAYCERDTLAMVEIYRRMVGK